MAKKRLLNSGYLPSWILKNVPIWSFGCHRVPNVLLCTKFHQNRMIFLLSNGGRRPSWIFDIEKLKVYVTSPLLPCYSASVCKISLIGQPAAELWPKTFFFLNNGRQPSWILKIFMFGHVTVTEFQICICVPNFIKIGWFFVEIWRFHDFQDGGFLPS